MTRQRVPLLVGVVVLLAAGCTADRDGAAPAQPTAVPSVGTTSATTSAPVPPIPTTRATDATDAPPAGSDWRVTYGWAVPDRPARVVHQVRVPVTPPPGPPLPALVEVRVGDHPDGGFSRITFAFRGATPSYEVVYQPQVEAEGTGEPIRLPGNAFLRVRFEQAQSHDARGGSSITASPLPDFGYPTLRGYGFAGDFEGYVTFGLGLAVASGSDQALPIRLGELTRPDGLHVVAVDVRRS